MTEERITHAEFDRLLLDFASLQMELKSQEDRIMRALLHPETGERYRKRVIDSGVPGLQNVTRAAAMIAPMVDPKSTETEKQKGAEAFLNLLARQKGAR